MTQPTTLAVSIRLLFILIGIGGINVHGQLQTEYMLDVQLLDQSNSLAIQQEIQIYNAGQTTLDTLYFNDWPSAFRDTDTPLSQRRTAQRFRRQQISGASRGKECPAGFHAEPTVERRRWRLLADGCGQRWRV